MDPVTGLRLRCFPRVVLCQFERVQLQAAVLSDAGTVEGTQHQPVHVGRVAVEEAFDNQTELGHLISPEDSHESVEQFCLLLGQGLFSSLAIVGGRALEEQFF